MELPSTLVGAVIATFAVLPGLPGEKVYSFVVGHDWRDDKWSRTLRLLAFVVRLACPRLVMQHLFTERTYET